MGALLVLAIALAATLVPGTPKANAALVADWVVQENALPGTGAWEIPYEALQDVQGYADMVSAQVGDRVRLFVDTSAPTFHVEAYRLGWYEGDGGRLIWTSAEVAGVDQPEPTMDPVTHMVEATNWSKSLAFVVRTRWVQGSYVLKLVSSTGGQAHVPLVIRDDTSTARIVFKHTVTTWQAYNKWGGASMYDGPSGGSSDRATKVSFDRPYYQHRGGGAMINALSLISIIESQGLDVTYITDLDFHARPALLRNHEAPVSAEHDEYWSTAMRKGLARARAAGVNLAFFGANAIYWHIRLEDSPLGENRRVVCYKSASKDTLSGVNDAEVTVKWRDPPLNKPETAVLGSMYGCYGVEPTDQVVGDADAWMFAGTGLQNGDVIPGMLGIEVDWVFPDKPTPGNLQVLSHSPVTCVNGVPAYTDMVYYTASSGAGVFHTGSLGWLSGMGCGPVTETPHCVQSAKTLTLNIIRAFARRPAGISHPAVPNAEEFGYVLTLPTSP